MIANLLDWKQVPKLELIGRGTSFVALFVLQEGLFAYGSNLFFGLGYDQRVSGRLLLALMVSGLSLFWLRRWNAVLISVIAISAGIRLAGLLPYMDQMGSGIVVSAVTTDVIVGFVAALTALLATGWLFRSRRVGQRQGGHSH